MLGRSKQIAWGAACGCFLTVYVFFVWLASDPSADQYINYARGHHVQRQPQEDKHWQWGHSDPGVTFVTFALAVIGAAQAVLFLWQLKLMRSEVKKARINLRIARNAAAAAGKSAEVAEKTLLATLRPKIRIKHVVLSSSLFENGKPIDTPITADITLINEGASDALLQEFGIAFRVDKSGRILPPITKIKFNKAVWQPHLRLGIGISAPMEKATDGIKLQGRQAYDIGNGTLKLYCMGYVHYLDGDNRFRTTAFCRVLKFSDNVDTWIDTGRFRQLEEPDPDYEYES